MKTSHNINLGVMLLCSLLLFRVSSSTLLHSAHVHSYASLQIQMKEDLK